MQPWCPGFADFYSTERVFTTATISFTVTTEWFSNL